MPVGGELCLPVVFEDDHLDVAVLGSIRERGGDRFVREAEAGDVDALPSGVDVIHPCLLDVVLRREEQGHVGCRRPGQEEGEGGRHDGDRRLATGSCLDRHGGGQARRARR